MSNKMDEIVEDYIVYLCTYHFHHFRSDAINYNSRRVGNASLRLSTCDEEHLICRHKHSDDLHYRDILYN